MAHGRSKKAEAQKGGPERAQGRPTREGEGPGGGKGAKEGWGSGTSRPYKTIHGADNCCCYCFLSCCIGFYSCCIHLVSSGMGQE